MQQQQQQHEANERAERAAIGAVAGGSGNPALAQLPPGVNVVSSPASVGGAARAMQLAGAVTNAFGQHVAVASSGVAGDHRGIAVSRMQQDEVEVMTDSCSSSSSEGF